MKVWLLSAAVFLGLLSALPSQALGVFGRSTWIIADDSCTFDLNRDFMIGGRISEAEAKEQCEAWLAERTAKAKLAFPNIKALSKSCGHSTVSDTNLFFFHGRVNFACDFDKDDIIYKP